ncbi:hypothetical protein RI367_008402 [Sorochytrium milnesiophthora]
MAHPPPLPPHVQARIDNTDWLKDTSFEGIKYVVGVDYGTTFSGFAIHEISSDGGTTSSFKVESCDTWPNQPPGAYFPKLPTVSTYDRATYALKSWGWTAAKDYTGQNVKISLPKLHLHPDVPEARRPVIPPELSVVKVITDYLAKLYECIVKMKPQLNKHNTAWCFTIPVNWKADALEVMREAAYEAGMIESVHSELLKFCEEPEAAALTCLEDSNVKLSPGQSFLVVDAGGGTVDLFLCRVGGNSQLDEITVGEGDFCGASFVDARFLRFLQENLGDEAFEELTMSSSAKMSRAWGDMESNWESKKRSFKGAHHMEEYDQLSFPALLYNAIPQEYKDILSEKQDGVDYALRITPQEMQSFFDPVVQRIKEMVVRQLQLNDGRVIEYIFFVGGFGSNQYLQDQIMSTPQVRQRVRHSMQVAQPESAVLRGAVRYGFNRSRIRTRKAASTIAMQVYRRPRTDDRPARETDPNLLRVEKVDRNGQVAEIDVLVLVHKGDTVDHMSFVTQRGLSFGRDSQSGAIVIYEIDSNRRAHLLGRIVIEIQRLTVRPKLTVFVNFGDLELRVRAVSEITGEECIARIQYDVGSGGRGRDGPAAITEVSRQFSDLSVSTSGMPPSANHGRIQSAGSVQQYTSSFPPPSQGPASSVSSSHSGQSWGSRQPEFGAATSTASVLGNRVSGSSSSTGSDVGSNYYSPQPSPYARRSLPHVHAPTYPPSSNAAQPPLPSTAAASQQYNSPYQQQQQQQQQHDYNGRAFASPERGQPLGQSHHYQQYPQRVQMSPYGSSTSSPSASPASSVSGDFSAFHAARARAASATSHGASPPSTSSALSSLVQSPLLASSPNMASNTSGGVYQNNPGAPTIYQVHNLAHTSSFPAGRSPPRYLPDDTYQYAPQ